MFPKANGKSCRTVFPPQSTVAAVGVGSRRLPILVRRRPFPFGNHVQPPPPNEDDAGDAHFFHAVSASLPTGMRCVCELEDQQRTRLDLRRTPQRRKIIMRRFIIERDIPQIGSAEREALRAAAQKSNRVLAELAPDIQWVESYVAADKTFCIYLAKDESIIRKHSEMSGFPASKITEVSKMIDPTTARA